MNHTAIQTVLSIRELIEEICVYLDAKSKINLYLYLNIHPPLKYVHELVNFVDNITNKYKDKYACPICECKITKKSIVVCSICKTKVCDECCCDCPAITPNTRFKHEFICQCCIKENNPKHMCIICKEICCCIENEQCYYHYSPFY